MSSLRTGLPYIWVTWLTPLLAGRQCVWSAWFKAHYRYEKYEPDKGDLVEWNREHNALMRDRRRELERDGYQVTVEDQNAFKIEGRVATVAGKPDLIASTHLETIIIDGKTGRERDSDIWQVLIYLFGIPKARPELVRGALSAEVHYKRGDQRITLPLDALTPEREREIVTLITTVASATPPRKVPSYEECKRCNIGRADCPQRVMEEPGIARVSNF